MREKPDLERFYHFFEHMTTFTGVRWLKYRCCPNCGHSDVARLLASAGVANDKPYVFTVRDPDGVTTFNEFGTQLDDEFLFHGNMTEAAFRSLVEWAAIFEFDLTWTGDADYAMKLRPKE